MGFWLAGLAGLLSVPAPAADWHLVGLLNQGDSRALLYFDRASLRTIGPDAREATVALHYESMRSRGIWRSYADRITFRVDCAAHTTRILDLDSLVERGWEDLGDTKFDVEANKPGTIRAATEELACNNGFGGLARVADPEPDARERFVHRRALVALPANVRWRQLGIVGIAPTRIAAFVEFGGPVRDSRGRLLATIMLVAEDRSRAVSRTDARFSVGCGTANSAVLYLREFDSSGSLVSENIEQRLLSDEKGNFAALMSPLCRGDWAALPEAKGFSQEVARSAFADR